MRFAFFPIMALLAASAARAAMPVDAWQVDGEQAKVAAAGIAVPMAASTLSLSKSGQIDNGDDQSGLDNYAQYLSEDGAIQATAYIYLPGYADAALADYMTDKAIADHFGPMTRRLAHEVTAAGGHKDTAIRAVYAGADGTLTTAAAFVRAGNWMIKLRITGPSERAGEVTAGLDALLAGLQFDDMAKPSLASAKAIPACPIGDQGEARKIVSSSTAANPNASPRNSLDALCIRGTVTAAEDRYDMLQSAKSEGGAATTVLIPLNDSGKVMRFDRANDISGYRMTIHDAGRTSVYQTYDRIPSARQIASIINEGANLQTASVQSLYGRPAVAGR